VVWFLRISFFKTQIMTGYHTYKTCIEACLKCAVICNHCASSCAAEEDVKMMVKCIQLCMECAAICYASAQLMSLGSKKAREVCALCADICKACGDECGRHQTGHCKECAKVCKQCSEECREMSQAS
jgi:hypothetical protein